MKKIYLMIVFALFAFTNIIAQTVLISPTGDGGFDNGSTFAANGWSESSSINNPWVIGGAITTAPFSGRSAYISDNGGTTNTYTAANSATNYFWRDVTVPAGETKIVLSLNWSLQGEVNWDNWQVFTAPTTITPIGVASHPGSGLTNVPSGITGATFVGNGTLTSGIQTSTFNLSPTLAGTTFRLIFSWKNEPSGAQPPAALDNISLTSGLPSNISSSAIGGLWSSTATWVGGAIPATVDNVTIVDGATEWLIRL
jgi:hypothetical protein